MLKNISKLGTVLNKKEQQSINGGEFLCYEAYAECERRHPSDFDAFDSCMVRNFCGWDQMVQL